MISTLIELTSHQTEMNADYGDLHIYKLKDSGNWYLLRPQMYGNVSIGRKFNDRFLSSTRRYIEWLR